MGRGAGHGSPAHRRRRRPLGARGPRPAEPNGVTGADGADAEAGGGVSPREFVRE